MTSRTVRMDTIAHLLIQFIVRMFTGRPFTQLHACPHPVLPLQSRGKVAQSDGWGRFRNSGVYNTSPAHIDHGAMIAQEKMVSRQPLQTTAVLPAGCHAHRLSHGVLRQVSRPLHRHAFFGLARRGIGSGDHVMALAIGKKSAIPIEGHFTAHRRLLRSTRRTYFTRLVKLGFNHVKSI